MSHSLLIVLTAAAVTIFIRALPFTAFPENRRPPHVVLYLSRILPAAVIGMLIVYCLRSASLTAWPHGLPEGIASAAVVLSYLIKKNTLLSILLGTVLYMALLQFVFV